MKPHIELFFLELECEIVDWTSHGINATLLLLAAWIILAIFMKTLYIIFLNVLFHATQCNDLYRAICNIMAPSNQTFFVPHNKRQAWINLIQFLSIDPDSLINQQIFWSSNLYIDIKRIPNGILDNSSLTPTHHPISHSETGAFGAWNTCQSTYNITSSNSCV